jgi:hypothetical protein
VLEISPEKCIIIGIPSGTLLDFIVSNQGIEASLQKGHQIIRIKPPQSKEDVHKLVKCIAALSIMRIMVFRVDVFTVVL